VELIEVGLLELRDRINSMCQPEYDEVLQLENLEEVMETRKSVTGQVQYTKEARPGKPSE